ncbi:hypothetical protein [Pseudomonas sp.]|uniref:hypothetical protein n=1 Tax=Pseudomonas sp. TaxID=306 RepID=UPI00258FC408|nr:hypothetical protein [Pseudomonas sp.]
MPTENKPADPKPTGLSQGWNLTRKHDGFVVGHQSVAYPPDEKAIERAECDGYVWVPFLVPAAQPQGEPRELREALQHLIDNHVDADGAGEVIVQREDFDELRALLDVSLADEGKPPAYKPGLYAVRHIDNWDGERDVTLTFAMLDADGKWTDKETGDALLAFRGDKVLRAWPLDCSDAPDTQVIGVPRNWLEDWALELVEAAQDGGQMSNQVEHLLELHAKP